MAKNGSKWQKMTVFWDFGESARGGLFIFQKVEVCRGVSAQKGSEKEI